tara:strand:- start:5823 stop:6161 length:339 start_codon:yes stop_codon:yes gene_type:complete
LYEGGINMGLRKIISKITSPFFVPLRRFIVWGDTKFGTCDMKLTLEPRWDNTLIGFADMDDGVVVASELLKKVSKDKANLETFEIENKSSIGNSFPPQQVIDHLRKKQQEEE